MRRVFAYLLALCLAFAPVANCFALSKNLKTILFKPRGIVKKGFYRFAYAASPQSVNVTANPGDQLVAFIVSYSATSTITSIGCTGESNMTAIGSLLRPGAGVLSDGAIQMYYLGSVTTGGTRSCTFTLSAATNLEGAVMVLSGGDPNNFLDSSNSAAATNVTVTSNYPRDAVLFMGLSGSGNSSGIYPYTYNAMARNLQADAAYDWLNSGVPGTKTAQHNGTGNVLIFAATFKAAP